MPFRHPVLVNAQIRRMKNRGQTLQKAKILLLMQRRLVRSIEYCCEPRRTGPEILIIRIRR